MRHAMMVSVVVLVAFLLGVGVAMAAQSRAKKPRAQARVEFYVLHNNRMLALPGKVNIVVKSIDGIVFSNATAPRMGGLTNQRGKVIGFADAPVSPSILPLIKRALQ